MMNWWALFMAILWMWNFKCIDIILYNRYFKQKWGIDE